MKKPFLIGNQWKETDTLQPVVNPWSGDIVAEVCVAGSDEVDLALETAVDAFPAAKAQPAHERSQILTAIGNRLLARKAEFAAALVAEAGKPVSLAEAEVDRAASTFHFAAARALSDDGHGIRMDASPQGIGHTGWVRRFPVGVILGVTPFNFPLNLVAHKVAPCLATGNTMILKPALKTPLSALLLAETLLEAGALPGQINILPFGHDEVDCLLADPRVKMLSFTGGVGVGWSLKRKAEKQKVALELGGNAAVVVDEDADWAAAIPKIASGAFAYAGQSCISVQRIFVHTNILDAFREKLVAHILDHIPAGDPADRRSLVGPMIDPAARKKILAWVSEAQSRGARLLTPLRSEGRAFLAPLLLENVPANASLACEEAFAPVACLDSFRDFDQALDAVNASAFGLQAGVFTRDVRKALRAFETLDVGGVLINEVPTFRVENMPYGGVKDSGFGREGVRYAMEEMTEPRSFILAS